MKKITTIILLIFIYTFSYTAERTYTNLDDIFRDARKSENKMALVRLKLIKINPGKMLTFLDRKNRKVYIFILFNRKARVTTNHLKKNVMYKVRFKIKSVIKMGENSIVEGYYNSIEK